MPRRETHDTNPTSDTFRVDSASKSEPKPHFIGDFGVGHFY